MEGMVIAMTAISKLFLAKMHEKSVYNIQAISNISSIIRHGLLSYELASALQHESVAMSDVQNKRSNVIIPQGKPLHSYASMYFDPRNPMMYRRQNVAERLCVLAISPSVLDWEGTILSDGNAASEYSRFYSPEEGLFKLDFEKIYKKWWTDDNAQEQLRLKRIKCAEVLVPNSVAYEYIIGAIVVNEHSQQFLISQGFQKKISIAPKVFFRKED